MSNKLLNKLLILALVILSIVALVLYKEKKESEKFDPIVIQNSFEEIAQLATIEYNYTNMAKYENYVEFYGYKIPFTTTKFIVTYDGCIKAGVDLSKCEISLVDENVLITLPPAQIISHEVDYDSFAIMEESQSVFNPIHISDYTQFSLDQNAANEEKAISKGLLEKATKNTQDYITNLITSLYPKYTITFQ